MTIKSLKPIFIFAVFLFMFNSSFANATPIERYITMLKNGVYTIKYEDMTPSTSKTNRDSAFMTSRGIDKHDDYLDTIYDKTKTVVVSDGTNRYEEYGTENYVLCKLQKGDEVFNFTRIKDKDKYVYIGNKKGEVSANKISVVNSIQEGLSFGNGKMAMLLEPLIANDKKNIYSLSFKQVASGSLPNGLFYTDYSATSQGQLMAVRYYFQGENMVKIAGGLYYTDNNGKINGLRMIMKIDEFSESADSSYLSLPSGIKDKTKR